MGTAAPPAVLGVAPDLGLDLSTPTGELVANVLAAVTQWERRMIGQRTSEALQVKIKTGWASPAWEPRVPRSVRRRIVKDGSGRGVAAGDREQAQRGRGASGRGESWHRGTVIRVLRQAA